VRDIAADISSERRFHIPDIRFFQFHNAGIALHGGVL
jgi:hypothetical protein